MTKVWITFQGPFRNSPIGAYSLAHIGVLCLPMPSHINLFVTLGEALRDRGHEVTFFNIPEVALKIVGSGLHFEAIEPDLVPPGTLFRMVAEMNTAGGMKALLIQGKFDALRYRGILEKAPGLVKAAGCDALVVDQAEPCSGSVAEMLGLPWISVSSGLCFNAEPDIPPFITGWKYRGTVWARYRNQLGWTALFIASQSIRRLVNSHRKNWGLSALGAIEDTFSPYAQISQQVAEFDFPRLSLPAHFHYVGPMLRKGAIPVAFPWERLDGRPIVYASLGTLLNRQGQLLGRIAEACVALPYQLVLSLGGGGTVEDYSGLPGLPLVVNFAPQRELLSKAALTVTHAGMNTTLESLSYGVPLVAIPLGFDQPAIAARIAWTGAGRSMNVRRASAVNIRHAIQCVIHSGENKASARRIGKAIARSGGARQAAGIIERVMETRSPVMTEEGGSKATNTTVLQ